MKTRRVLPLLLLMLTIGCSSATPTKVVPSQPVAVESFAGIPRYEAGGLVTPPKLVSKVDPQLTQRLRNHRSLEAEIEAVINEEGRVIGVLYVSGDREWAQAAADAIRKWRFEPATLERKPVRVRFPITTRMH